SHEVRPPAQTETRPTSSWTVRGALESTGIAMATPTPNAHQARYRPAMVDASPPPWPDRRGMACGYRTVNILLPPRLAATRPSKRKSGSTIAERIGRGCPQKRTKSATMAEACRMVTLQRPFAVNTRTHLTGASRKTAVPAPSRENAFVDHA